MSVARSAETAVVFAGLPDRFESEGFDREHMRMPEGHLRMIEAVARANPRTVVVLLCGSAVECPWADQVQAILYMGLPGEAGGEAVANLLYGRVNPYGRLAESWPLRYEDVPSSAIYGKTRDALKAPHSCDYAAHHALAREAAEQGAVLLKNDGGLLPLEEKARIAVIGVMAKAMRFQGAGSSHINPMHLSQPLDFLPGAAYAPGCD